MYALAGVLRVAADQINDAVRRIPNAVRDVDAQGNFIATYRGDASDAQRRAGRAASRLHAAADVLETAAPGSRQPTSTTARSPRGPPLALAKRGDLHALSTLGQDKFTVHRLFAEIAAGYTDRPGDTRILKLGPRRSDSTEMVFLELVQLEGRVSRTRISAGARGASAGRAGSTDAAKSEGERQTAAGDADGAAASGPAGVGGKRAPEPEPALLAATWHSPPVPGRARPHAARPARWDPSCVSRCAAWPRRGQRRPPVRSRGRRSCRHLAPRACS